MEFIHLLLSSLFSPYKPIPFESDTNSYLHDIVPKTAWSDENFALQFLLGGILAEFLHEDNPSHKHGIRAFVKKSTFPDILLVADGTIVDLRIKTREQSFLDQNEIDNLMCTFYPDIYTGKSLVMKMVLMNPATFNTAMQIHNQCKINSEPTDGFCKSHDFVEVKSRLITLHDDFLPDKLPYEVRPIIKAVNSAIAFYRFWNNQGDGLIYGQEQTSSLDFSGIISGALLLSLHTTCNVTVNQINDRLFIGASPKTNNSSTVTLVLYGLSPSRFPSEVTVCLEIMMGLHIFGDSCALVSLQGQVAINERQVEVAKLGKGFLKRAMDYISRFNFQADGLKQEILDQFLDNLLKKPYTLNGCDGFYRIVGELLGLEKHQYPTTKPKRFGKFGITCPKCVILVTKRRDVRFIINIEQCKDDDKDNLFETEINNIETCNVRHPHRRYQCSHLLNLNLAKAKSSITTMSVLNKDFDVFIQPTSETIYGIDLARWLKNSNNQTPATFSNSISSMIENNCVADITNNQQVKHVMSGIIATIKTGTVSVINDEVLSFDYPPEKTTLIIKTTTDEYVETISEFVSELDLIMQLRNTVMLSNKIFVEMHIEPDTMNISVTITNDIDSGDIHSARPIFSDYTQTVFHTCDPISENLSRSKALEKEVCKLITGPPEFLPKPSEFKRLKKLLQIVSRNAAILTVLQGIKRRFENYELVKFKNDLLHGKMAAIDSFLDRVLESLTVRHKNNSYSLVKSPSAVSIVKPTCHFVRNGDLLGHLSQQGIFHDKHRKQVPSTIHVSEILADYCNICLPSSRDCKTHHDTQMLLLPQASSNFFNGSIRRLKQVLPHYAYILKHTSITKLDKSTNLPFCKAFAQLLDTREGSFNITGCGEDNVLSVRLHDRVKSKVYVNRLPNQHSEDVSDWPPTVLMTTGIHHIQLRLVGETFMEVDCTFRTVLIKKEDDSCDSISVKHSPDYCASDLRIYSMGNSRILVHSPRQIHFIVNDRHTTDIIFSYRSASDSYIFQVNLNIIDLLAIQSHFSEFTLTFKEGGKLLIHPNLSKDMLKLHFQDALLVLSISHFPVVLIEVDISTEEVSSWLANLKFRDVYIDVYCRKSHELYSVRFKKLYTNYIRHQCISVQTHVKMTQRFLTDFSCFEININAQSDKNLPTPTVYLTSIDNLTVFHVHTKPLCEVYHYTEFCQIVYSCALEADSVTITISVKLDQDTEERKIIDLSFFKLNVGTNLFPKIDFFGHGKLEFLYDPMMNRARVVPQTLSFSEGTELAILDSCSIEPRSMIVVDQHRRFFETYRVTNHLVFTTITKAVMKQRYEIRLFTLALLDFYAVGLEKMILMQFTRRTVDVAEEARTARSLAKTIAKFETIDRENAELISLMTTSYDVFGESEESDEDDF